MPPRAFSTDVLVLTPEGSPVALVEAKNREGLSREIAAELRRNLMVHGLLQRVPYFLLVTQDRGFLWEQHPGSELPASPAAEFSMESVVRRYLPQVRSVERLRGAQLAFIVAQWLNELASGQLDLSGEPERLLAPTGFLAEIQGGAVRAGIAA